MSGGLTDSCGHDVGGTGPSLEELREDMQNRLYKEPIKVSPYSSETEFCLEMEEKHMTRLGVAIGYTTEQKGFPRPTSIEDVQLVSTKLMLIVTEVAEAMEEVRKGNAEKFAEELADVVIRVLDLSDSLGIDLQNEVVRKMWINELRPMKHGKRI